MKRVMITREVENSKNMLSFIESFDIKTFFLPLIKTSPISGNFLLDSYDYAIITSPTAAYYFSTYASLISINKYFAIGKSTALTLDSLKLSNMDNIAYPDRYYFQEIIHLFDRSSIDGSNIVSPGAKVRIADFSNYFLSRNVLYDKVDIYETVNILYPKGYVNNFIIHNCISDIAFFSPSAVKSFFDNLLYFPKDVKYFAIGLSTASVLTSMGIDVYIADNQTAESVLKKIYEIKY